MSKYHSVNNNEHGWARVLSNVDEWIPWETHTWVPETVPEVKLRVATISHNSPNRACPLYNVEHPLTSCNEPGYGENSATLDRDVA